MQFGGEIGQAAARPSPCASCCITNHVRVHAYMAHTCATGMECNSTSARARSAKISAVKFSPSPDCYRLQVYVYH